MSSERKSAVTIYELAKHVGVSTATVSSVLANRHVERRIAAKTVQRIRDAARELGYVPNMAGRRLRSRSVAIRQFDLAIFTAFEAPLPLVSGALNHLQREVDAHSTKDTRYAVAIEMFHAGRLHEKPALLEANRYHGVFITNTLPEDDRFLTEARLPYPVVVLGRRIEGYSCVLEAPQFVGRNSADELARAGCREFAVLRGKRLTYTTSDRVAAFKQRVMERTGMAPVELVSEGLKPAEAFAAVQRHLQDGLGLDGLFCVTDSLTIGAYQALKREGLRIPHDVAVVGVGDNELAEFMDPPLTTVAGANDAMVAEAVPLLFRMLGGEATVAREILAVPPILSRSSTERT